jgi:16S rRNA processing protein RimM
MVGPNDNHQDAGLTAIGSVSKPVGLKGWCAVSAIGDTLAGLSPPCTLLVGRNERTARPMALTGLVHGQRGFRCLFEGCEDRDTAESMRSLTLFVADEQLPELGEGEYYHFELEGMEVVAEEGNQLLGIVERVHNYPTTDALEVKTPGGRKVIVPMAGGAIQGIDKLQRRVTVSAEQLEELL